MLNKSQLITILYYLVKATSKTHRHRICDSNVFHFICIAYNTLLCCVNKRKSNVPFTDTDIFVILYGTLETGVLKIQSSNTPLYYMIVNYAWTPGKSTLQNTVWLFDYIH